MPDSPENNGPLSKSILGMGHLIGGRYRVHGLLGRGGMGVVYAATHELTQRRVALKVVDADSQEQPAQRERFLSEARTAAAVRHPNIVDILDMGMHRGSPYLVMEHLEGTALDALLGDHRPLSFEQCLSWLLPIMGALATLHDAGIVHRDVKPSNIFLARVARDAVVPKLLDFGLARAVSDARLTRSGVVIGTPLYMAPEHACGAQTGPGADVWSMGVVLFESVTGALPFSSTDRAVIAAQVLAGHVRPVRQVRGDVPKPLATAIDTALQRDLSLRHANMRALAQTLVSAAVASGIALPEHPDPLGLPDYASWLSRAQARFATGDLATESTQPGRAPWTALSAAQPVAENQARARRWAYLVLLVSVAFALGVWLWPRARPLPVTPTHDLSPPRAQEAAPGPELPAPGSTAPDVASTADTHAADAASPTAPKRPQSNPRSRPRKSGAEPSQHKSTGQRRAPEVETEWK